MVKCLSRQITLCSPVWPGSAARTHLTQLLRWDTKSETCFLCICQNHSFLILVFLVWVKVKVVAQFIADFYISSRDSFKCCQLEFIVLLLHNANPSCSGHTTSPVKEKKSIRGYNEIIKCSAVCDYQLGQTQMQFYSNVSLCKQQFILFFSFFCHFSVQHYPGGWQDWVKNEQHN